jgi:hypothetical protein
MRADLVILCRLSRASAVAHGRIGGIQRRPTFGASHFYAALIFLRHFMQLDLARQNVVGGLLGRQAERRNVFKNRAALCVAKMIDVKSAIPDQLR